MIRGRRVPKARQAIQGRLVRESEPSDRAVELRPDVLHGAVW